MTVSDEKEFSIIPYSPNIIAQAERYCDLVHLPKEAVSAVLRALDNHRKLNQIIEQQKALPPEKRKALVDTKNPLADEPMRMIDEFVEMHMIPYTSMTWIEGKPYPKADGLRYKLQADPRVVKSVTVKPLETPPLVDQNNMMVGRECIVEFFNGEVYHDEGWVDLAELQTRRSRSNVSPGFMSMIAVTRAKRRCTLAALGLPTGVAEEVAEGTEYETVSAEAAKVTIETKPVPSTPTNLAQLIAAAYSYDKTTAQELAGVLGKPLKDIVDFAAAFRVFVARRKAAERKAQ